MSLLLLFGSRYPEEFRPRLDLADLLDKHHYLEGALVLVFPHRASLRSRQHPEHRHLKQKKIPGLPLGNHPESIPSPHRLPLMSEYARGPLQGPPRGSHHPKRLSLPPEERLQQVPENKREASECKTPRSPKRGREKRRALN